MLDVDVFDFSALFQTLVTLLDFSECFLIINYKPKWNIDVRPVDVGFLLAVLIRVYFQVKKCVRSLDCDGYTGAGNETGFLNEITI